MAFISDLYSGDEESTNVKTTCDGATSVKVIDADATSAKTTEGAATKVKTMNEGGTNVKTSEDLRALAAGEPMPNSTVLTNVMKNASLDLGLS